MDYKQLGLKAGLEIHQQLDTGRKLFCKCPAYLRTDKPDIIIKRKLHPVPGETGEVDTAVEFEAAKEKEFIYEGYSDSTCLVEYDEAPPYFIDENALDEALKIALLLNCEIYPISQIMRKTVIDGSNTSGFQRTALIAHNGFLELSFGKVGIDALFLEEDSARPAGETSSSVASTRAREETCSNNNSHTKTYKLDRLGIPLVEIATGPHLHTPEQIKECALKIGEILRACKVKRGIGTIRQDLNISIKGHDKVEIKGFQEPKIMINTINFEVERQIQELKEGKKTGEVRWSLADGKTEYARPMPGQNRMYPETDLPLLKISRDRLNKLKRALPKLKQEIKDELRKKGLNEELINLVLSSNSLEEFEVLLNVCNDANLVAKMAFLWRQELSIKKNISLEKVKEILNERMLEKILEAVAKSKFPKEHVRNVMSDILEGKSIEDALKIESISHDKLEEEIHSVIKEKPGLRPSAYMGLLIQKLGAIIDKRKAMEILKRLVENRN